MAIIIGKISNKVIETLNIKEPIDCNVYLGESNIQHMQSKHPADYSMYGDQINLILSDPDFVGINPADDSIEYVKEFSVNNDFVKVAVRISAGSQRYYARSIYVLNPSRVHNFIRKGTLKKLN